MGRNPYGSIFLYRGVSSEAGPHLPVQVRLARDLGDCLQSRNVPFGTSGDYLIGNFIRSNKKYSGERIPKKIRSKEKWLSREKMVKEKVGKVKKSVLNCEKLTKSLLVLQCFLFYF